MCKSEIFAKIIALVSKGTEIPTELIVSDNRVTEIVNASKFPSGMKLYLESYGFHFSKKLYEWAVSKMKVKDEATGKEKKLEPWSKDEVDDMLKANGITIEHDKGYDVAYVANMLKADFYKKSLVDEAHLCKHIKCYLDDIDGDPCRAFDEFFATCIGKGIPVIWSDVI